MNEFKLFISGETAKTRKISGNIETFLKKAFGRKYAFDVIDVIKCPHLAQANGVLATPTLVRMTPPMKRVLGDFSDMGKVLERLDIHFPPDTAAAMENNGGQE